MTFSVNGNDIGQMIEIALTVISIVGLVIGAFLVWLMVRPPKHVRQQRQQPQVRETDALEFEEMVRMLDRMEERLAVLERAIGHDDEAPRLMRAGEEDELTQAGGERPETRRTTK
jgi:hypothetical protein